MVYRFTSGGQRDFTSVSLVVAAKYEVLCEHKHAHRGREMLAEMDPMRAAEQELRRVREAEQARVAQQQAAAAAAARSSSRSRRRPSGEAGPDCPLTGGPSGSTLLGVTGGDDAVPLVIGAP